jgi:hypothetical protein
MLMRHSSRNQFSASASHLGEQLFTSLIDESDLSEINDCAGQGRSIARVFPARAQFVHPGSGEAPMQAPTLPVGCIGITDSKHIQRLFAFKKSIRAAEVCTLILKDFAKLESKSLLGYRHTVQIWAHAEGYRVATNGKCVPKVLSILRHMQVARHKRATANEGNPRFSVDLKM